MRALKSLTEGLRWRPALGVTLAYGLLIALLYQITWSQEVALYGGGIWRGPTGWLLLIWSVVYVLPLALAAGFGALVRPFWRHAGLLLVLIFGAHLVYSLATSAALYRLRAQWDAERAARDRAVFTLEKATPTLVDENGDGLIEAVEIRFTVAHRQLPAGTYDVAMGLDTPLARRRLGAAELRSASDVDDQQDMVLRFDPHRIAEELAGGQGFEFFFEVTYWREPGFWAGRTTRLCGWAAFICAADWAGRPANPPLRHSDIGGANLAITLGLALEDLQRDAVMFRNFVSDLGRDSDGDGLFEGLVLTLAVDSIYDGPVWLTGQIEADPPIFLRPQANMAPGQGRIAFLIPGRDLVAAGLNGPYRLTTLTILNNSPTCPRLPCEFPHQPVWSLYLPDYTTKDYAAAAFQTD